MAAIAIAKDEGAKKCEETHFFKNTLCQSVFCSSGEQVWRFYRRWVQILILHEPQYDIGYLCEISIFYKFSFQKLFVNQHFFSIGGSGKCHSAECVNWETGSGDFK